MNKITFEEVYSLAERYIKDVITDDFVRKSSDSWYYDALNWFEEQSGVEQEDADYQEACGTFGKIVYGAFRKRSEELYMTMLDKSSVMKISDVIRHLTKVYEEKGDDALFIEHECNVGRELYGFWIDEETNKLVLRYPKIKK